MVPQYGVMKSLAAFMLFSTERLGIFLNAVNGDIVWTPMSCKVKTSILNQWCRLVNMNRNRLNRKVFQWPYSCKGSNCKKYVFQSLQYDFKV